MSPKICLCLTEKTIAENLDLANQYRNKIDLVELRVDCLSDDECYYIRSFPEKVGIPTILTIRRKIDGGNWSHGEATRTTLFARALAFSETNSAKNFAYVDFEEDVNIPCLRDAVLSSETTIIRSAHIFDAQNVNLDQYFHKLQRTGLEIPKIAITPHSLHEASRIYSEAQKLDNKKRIISPMGIYGQPLRTISSRIKSEIIYTSKKNRSAVDPKVAQIDIDTLLDILKLNRINADTKLFAITGNPLTHTRSPNFHNNKFAEHGMNRFYFSLPSPSIQESLEFANITGIRGMSITAPFKEAIIPYLKGMTTNVRTMNSCNTIIRKNDGWYGFNTDLEGILFALTSFLNRKNLKNMAISIIGAGGVAKSFAQAVKQLHGNACIFNRHVGRARNIAEQYGFKAAPLHDYDSSLLTKYSDLIIQATTLGMTGSEEDDPLSFYDFSGNEAVFDSIYEPEETPILRRAREAGCKTQNGLSMFIRQAEAQFKLFSEA